MAETRIHTRAAVRLVSVLAVLLGCSYRPSSAKPHSEVGVTGGSTAAPIEPQKGHAASRASAQPLLLRPEFDDVRLAFEAEDDELAAATLETKMRERSRQGEECWECYYLLGVLEERRGAVPRAIAAFEAASQSSWTLSREALVHLVRLELSRRNCARADQLLEQLGGEDLAPSGLGVLRAEVDLCQGRIAPAITKLRALVAAKQEERRRAPLRLLLAQALLEPSVPDDALRQSNEDEARQLLEAAVAQPGLPSTALERARRLFEQLQRTRRVPGAKDDLGRERVALLEAFVDARRWIDAQKLAAELAADVDSSSMSAEVQCRLQFANGRVASATGNRRPALDSFEWAAERCDDSDLAVRALFLAAGIDAAAGRRAEAIAKYARVERRYPTHRLADDARLKQAALYRAVGSESRFVALLDAMPDDYPDGDMVLEGLFQLAQKSMLQRNWASARSVLERSERFAANGSSGKDVELDRIRYFLGKLAITAGNVDEGLGRFRELIASRPLTYYMLLARSEWARLRPEELVAVEDAAIAASRAEASPTPPNVEEACPRDLRLRALLGVGDLRAADELLDSESGEITCERTVFALAGMYAEVGATKTALTLVKRRGRDWRVRWPEGGWVDVWKQAFPRPYRQLVRQQATKLGVSESLVYAIMREESEFDPKAVSSAEAYGLMQLIVPTARIAGRELGISVDARALQKPAVNIAVGTRTLAKLSERFGAQTALIAAGYNAGPGRPTRWLREFPEVDMDLWVELIEFAETRQYVKRVMESEAAYRWLYGANGAAGATIDVWPARLTSGRDG